MRKVNYMEKKLNVVAIRLVEERPLISETKIQSPNDAVKVLGDYMCQLDKECLCVINLRSDGCPVNCSFVSMGAANESMAHPREIYKSAILANATSMILLHNHPSGNLSPSKEDTMITDRMLKLGELIGIPLVDHVIVGGKNLGFFSFREKQLMEYDHTKFETDYYKLNFESVRVAEIGKDEQSDLCVDEIQSPNRRRGR